ncbi:hypothetical protein C0992_004877 [Termitomyces sp. T32_za158]|nr:hypothetical protein C0992_004877 [Termitomyces sp. T32_za158]
MRVFEKWLWHKGQAVEVTWSWENKLWEWCMARYMENAGAAWLAPFEANFLWTELSPNSKVAAYVEPLVQMDLARQECQWAEAATQSAAIMSAEQEAELLEERQIALAEFLAKRIADAQAAGFLEAVGAASGGKVVEVGEAAAGLAVAAGEVATAEPADESKAPETDNDADNEDEVPAMPKRVPTAGGSGRSPAVIKKASKSTTPSKRCTQKVVPQYKLPTATTFTDAQLRNLLVPCRDEVVLDNNHRAGENVPGVKGKKTVLLAAHDDCKARKGSCDKCWADNDPKCCWYLTGAQPCHRCDALKRACTISGQKSRERSKVNPHVQRNFEKAVLVRRARAFVLGQQKLSAAGKAISISVSSLALPTVQESGVVVDVVDLAPTTPKGKGKVASTPRKQRASTSGDERPAKQYRSGTAHVVLSEPESPSVARVQSEPEEAAESSNSSESLSDVPAVPLQAVQPNYAPLLIPHVDGQKFLWLGKALDYPISVLRPTQYIEAAKEKAAGMVEVMQKDMWAAAVEMEGL